MDRHVLNNDNGGRGGTKCVYEVVLTLLSSYEWICQNEAQFKLVCKNIHKTTPKWIIQKKQKEALKSSSGMYCVLIMMYFLFLTMTANFYILLVVMRLTDEEEVYEKL